MRIWIQNTELKKIKKSAAHLELIFTIDNFINLLVLLIEVLLIKVPGHYKQELRRQQEEANRIVNTALHQTTSSSRSDSITTINFESRQ